MDRINLKRIQKFKKLTEKNSKPSYKKGGLSYSQITKDQQPGGVNKKKTTKPIPRVKPNRKGIPKYKFGAAIADIGRGYIDMVGGAFGMKNLINEDDYQTKGGKDFGAFYDEKIQPVAQATSQTALSAIPGAQPFVTAGYTAAGIADQSNPGPNKDSGLNTDQNIYAQHRPDYFAQGGMPSNQIEVEGPELEVKNGKILKDFKGKPSHRKGGYTYDAKSGRVIIPVKDREKYMKSDSFTRNSMERRLILDQRKRDSEQAHEYNELMKCGGMKYNHGGLISYHPMLSPEKTSKPPTWKNIGNSFGTDIPGAMSGRPKEFSGPLKGLGARKFKQGGMTPAQNKKMEKHAEHHSQEHMNLMIEDMMNGMSFTEAHNKAKKITLKEGGSTRALTSYGPKTKGRGYADGGPINPLAPIHYPDAAFMPKPEIIDPGYYAGAKPVYSSPKPTGAGASIEGVLEWRKNMANAQRRGAHITQQTNPGITPLSQVSTDNYFGAVDPNGNQIKRKGGMTYRKGGIPKYYPGGYVGAGDDPLRGTNVSIPRKGSNFPEALGADNLGGTSFINTDQYGNPIGANKQFAPKPVPSGPQSFPLKPISLGDDAPFNPQAIRPTPLNGEFKERKRYEPDWMKIGSQVGVGLPIAFNTLGAFGPAHQEAPIYNPYEAQTKDLMAKRNISLDPIRRDLYAQERIGAQPMGAESQGAYLSRRGQLTANTQRALADVGVQQQQINQGYRGEEAQMLDRLGMGRQRANMMARQQSIANMTNRQQFLPKAIEQASMAAQYPQYKREFLDAKTQTAQSISDLYKAGQMDKATHDQLQAMIKTSEYTPGGVYNIKQSGAI